VTTNDNWPSLYILAIGKSSTGKEHCKNTAEELLKAAGLKDALVGPNKYTSDAGVLSALIERPTHIHINDELGLQLEAANKDRGVLAKEVTRFQMECFGRCQGELQPVGYATFGMTKNQREEAKNRRIVKPALTILSMTTPGTFYDAITSAVLRNGYLNRFIVMECHEARTKSLTVKGTPPPQEVIDWCKRTRFGEAYGRADAGDLADAFVDAPHDAEPTPWIMEFAPEALESFDAFEDRCIAEQNALDKVGMSEMWGRTREIAMRVAMIVAKSCEESTISKQHADWAIQFVAYWTTEMVYSADANIAESGFDSASKDVTRLVYAAGSAGLTRNEMRNASRKFRSLQPALQSAVLNLLLEDGEHSIQDRQKTRGPKAKTFVHRDFLPTA
jgi:hypothetical protein